MVDAIFRQLAASGGVIHLPGLRKPLVEREAVRRLLADSTYRDGARVRPGGNLAVVTRVRQRLHDPRWPAPLRVRYRLGGRDTKLRSAGSVATRREADARARWVAGELAAMRVPDLDALTRAPERTLTLAEVADRYLATRVDAKPSTTKTYRQAFLLLGALGERAPAEIRPADVQA